ncbi:6-phosphofructokinase [Chitinophaga polysaccharea]|uniref:ATP-dependent 6-phosphofructokinase n=1 Tax=Chitinophaga eiseniae TaxID=634771 RepID=A0A847SQM9_9BACT|nr:MULTISPECIES: 6-phosphofructokinase [Chitinophaga]NLR57284.1 6-phosphofructokinase [Chitinophaga polysaccharea]NLR79776.1 6-phosphofructokinase [Chitinophaga eiseniae]NLU91598.1 6-phosphofructokinase [Chitinophaga sp. Ak27]
MKKLNNIAVLTSGGDAPGMNAAVRAVVRTGIYHQLNVYGIMYGYRGMLKNEIFPMESKSVANIIQRGGTILKTARCREFYEYEGRKMAYENLKKHNIDGLVVIGGDGSFNGAQKFSQEFDIPCIGLPGTIDKDIAGTDSTIGFDTAVNTAVEAIDKIRDTADAHDRLFVIEVMGRDAGYIALHSGISTGAEHILMPERKTEVNDIIEELQANERRRKLVNLIVVAEGDETGGAQEVGRIIKERCPQLDTRVSILGHIQRGGAPTCTDRILASRLGYAAVDALLEGIHNVMIGVVNDRIHYTPLDKAVKAKQEIDPEWFKIVKILAS